METVRCRRLGIALTTVAFALLLISPSSEAATPGECAVRSAPSFTAQGLNELAASVGDVVEVSCSGEAGQPVTLEDSGLYARCGNQLNWAQPVPYVRSSGASFGVTLDTFGNATAVMWASGCAAGETHVRATLGVPPNTVRETSFAVLPPSETVAGVTALPHSQVEGAEGSLATVIEAEFAPRDAERKVELNAAGLFHRCATKPHLHWIFQGRERAGGKVARVTLDNNGNAFAIVLGGPSCAVGESLIVAQLIRSPYTYYTTNFIGLPPREVL
jgi:hypothetical protein